MCLFPTVEKYDFYFHECRHVVDLVGIEEHNKCIILHHIYSGWLRLCKRTFAYATVSQIARDKQKSWTILSHKFLEEIENNIL